MAKPTIVDVAKKAGVGVGTVSRVLNNSPQISETTRKKVLSAIEELKFVPNVAGKRLSSKKSNVIAVLVPVLTHPFFSNLVAEIEKEAEKVGYSLLLCCSQHNIDKEKEILGRIASKEADGAIFVTHYEHDEKDLEKLALVSIDRHLTKNIPLITTNNYEATKEALESFLSQGLKKIAYLGTKSDIPSEVNKRAKAYLDVMKEHELEPILIHKNIPHGEEIELVEQLLNTYKDIEAVFVSGYSLARLLSQELEARKIKVPEELQIIYYDGDCSFEKSVKMTTLAQPVSLIAKKSVELLIARIEGRSNIPMYTEFKCEFIKGNSTK